MNPAGPLRIHPVMVAKNDFTAAEWTTLRDTPYLVGVATLMAGSSGLATIRESIALAQGIMDNQSSNIPFIRDLTSRPEMQSSQASMRQTFGPSGTKPTPENVRRVALEQARSAISVLESKAGKEEVDTYRRMLYSLAEKVASAAREGGILGFGGVQISEGEASFLSDLRNTIQLEQVKRA